MTKSLKAKEAAQFLGAHVETVRRLARRGELPAFKVGKDWRFNEDAIKRWSETNYYRLPSVHVLVVDDEEPMLHVISHILLREGYRVSTKTDGAEAVELARRKPPDLLCLDLEMPGMSGPEVLAEMRKIQQDLPVIIVTGYPDSNLMMAAMRYSPIMVIPKPFQAEQLIKAVDMALKGSRTPSLMAYR